MSNTTSNLADESSIQRWRFLLSKTALPASAIPIVLVLASCGEVYRIEKILINPSTVLGGTEQVTPLTLFASVPATIVNLDFDVVFKRADGFNDPIDFRADVNLRPSSGNAVFVNGSNYGAETSSRRAERLLIVMCKRIEPPGGEATVELEVAHAFGIASAPSSVRPTGTTSASVTANVSVASESRGGRAARNAERPLVITCLRDNPLM